MTNEEARRLGKAQLQVLVEAGGPDGDVAAAELARRKSKRTANRLAREAASAPSLGPVRAGEAPAARRTSTPPDEASTLNGEAGPEEDDGAPPPPPRT